MKPVRDPDSDQIALTQRLLRQMRHATLAVIDPETGHPHLSRIACQLDADGTPLALLSGIAAHSHALARCARAGLMIAPAPAAKGDPMSQPRLSLQVLAAPAPPDPGRRDRWLAAHPRARVYIDLPDFRFWHLRPVSGLLNAGFGAAFRLTPAEMTTPPEPIGSGGDIVT